MRATILKGADLTEAKLLRSLLSSAMFEDAVFGETLIADMDFSDCLGLGKTLHRGPSSIDVRTLSRSKGRR